ncbi:unnamed protein product [Nyctereutes procyonoides]|uniref:Small ribosomal subunit protein eS8 n=1 Tax=Nyctereutes procyonoides TaxID=34880 RepID=A0A811Z8T6_NYCPR|nr:unnamed protein product [Nyctereutes procyonoides]
MSMGISRDNWHKRRKTGGKRKPYHRKQKYELGRPAANTEVALRLDVGNFSWGSECCTHKTRIINVYNASNNELVCTKTPMKNRIVLIDSTPNRQCYESHYALPLGRKKEKIQKKYDQRKKNAKISSLLEEQPGQCGRAGGYVLEGKELEFYLRKIKAWKGK